MNEEIQFQQPDGLLDHIFAFFPPELWGWIILAALAVFFFTQAIKFVFKANSSLPGLGPTLLRAVAVLSAYPITYCMLIMSGNAPAHWVTPVPIALIAWGLSHVLAEYGMSVLYCWKPTLARRINADADMRFRDKGPPRGKYERRRDRSA